MAHPGEHDARLARRALLLFAKLGFPDLVVLVHDADDRPDRRAGFEQARSAVATSERVVIGIADPEREAWLLAGFVPRDERERGALAAERQRLGFDPTLHPHELRGNAKRSAKTALASLVGEDRAREDHCLTDQPLAHLRQRGEGTGLAAFLDEIDARIVPVIGGRRSPGQGWLAARASCPRSCAALTSAAMRQRGSSLGVFGVLGVLGLLASACGDDAGTTPADGSTSASTTDVPATDTIPLPTGTTTAEPGTSTVDPDTTAGDTGVPADVPGPELDDCTRLDELLAALPAAAADEQPALVDGFVRAVTYGDHGFPIVCDGTLSVVHVADPGQSLSLAGDFNGWMPGEHALQEPVDGLGFYVVSAPTDAPAGLYKLVRDEVEFFADPLARRFGWDEFGEYSQVDPLPDRGHHERWPAFDEAVGALEPRTVTAWLPAGAFDEAELPVLYMHDGQNLFSPDAFFGGWRVSETLAAAIADGTLPPLVVIGIDNTSARFEEYTPVTDVLDGMRVGGRADEYADFLVQGVKPFAEARYPVSSDPSLVGTMGSSLGGLVSLYIGLRHPDVFGQVASMSGTIEWGTFGASSPTIIDLYQDDAPLGLRIYVDSGGDEGSGCPGDGSDNYCGNVAFADLLRATGWQDEVDLFYRWDPGAPHNEAAWADRLLPALVDWFPTGG